MHEMVSARTGAYWGELRLRVFVFEQPKNNVNAEATINNIWDFI